MIGRQAQDHRKLRASTSHAILALALLAIVAPSVGRSSAGPARLLTFEDRVRHQRAIEEVYWRHRIWPAENSLPKPSLGQVLSDEAIRAEVEDYMAKSAALGSIWARPIVASQLQEEIDRMARSSRAPDILHELFGALGNDPFVVAETLGRQGLADRLIREFYARDRSIHGDVRAQAEAALSNDPDLPTLKANGADYRETIWVREVGEDAGGISMKSRGSADAGPGRIGLHEEAWLDFVSRLAARFGQEGAGSGLLECDPLCALPVGSVSPLREEDDRFAVMSILEKAGGELRIAEASWHKRSFDEWWDERRAAQGIDIAVPAAGYSLAGTTATACAPDAWTLTASNVPGSRILQTAVWTGSEMIVWGGQDELFLPINTGGRYDPATDRWRATSTGPSVPDGRVTHTAVWTGSEMIVWGGNGYGLVNSGGRYNPATDRWTPTSKGANVPTPRSDHTAVWTGSEMIVWAGTNQGNMNSGGRYDPVTDSWIPTAAANAPGSRERHSAVWTGSEMIVWGGFNYVSFLNDGGRYDPASDSWNPVSTGPDTPSARFEHSAVWTGSEMIVWGGNYQDGSGGSYFYNTGGRYDPVTDRWMATSVATGVPSGRTNHSIVWTGSEMIVWGGWNTDGTTDFFHDTGGRYDPSTDAWAPTTLTGAPSARFRVTGIWTGSEMIVWGGGIIPPVWPPPRGEYFNSGGRYDPATDTWTATSREVDVPAPRDAHTAVWTGAEMIVWGGSDAGLNSLNTGGLYDPATDRWRMTNAGASAPVGRHSHTAVWTGLEMIVWGGKGARELRTGGRLDPVTNSWKATSLLNAPEARAGQTAVWTGTQMIVWGGTRAGTYKNSGGRYNPATDAWVATSLATGVPRPRVDHTAVWSGTEMIVWGGVAAAGYQATGSRYDPVANRWTATSTGANAPTARASHTAVWTGTEMIVWGGTGLSGPRATGSRYRPSNNTWVSVTSAAGGLSARFDHTAAWTGYEMIVWGGQDVAGSLDTGGRYAPATNFWVATSSPGGVQARSGHTVVLTGHEMTVWGGKDAGSIRLDSGGLYCYAP